MKEIPKQESARVSDGMIHAVGTFTDTEWVFHNTAGATIEAVMRR